MRILIATPLYPPDVGGPSTYSFGLEQSLREIGHHPIVLCYRQVMYLPSGVRQLAFAWKVFTIAYSVDAVIALDTLSIGLPAMLAAKIFRKVGIIRVAGDQLWERYVNRTKEIIPLPEFYIESRSLGFTEKIMHTMTTLTFFLAQQLVFSTRWQADVRSRGYPGIIKKIAIIENAYTLKQSGMKTNESQEKIFVWAGRDIPLKNVERLKDAFIEAKKVDHELSLELVMRSSHEKVLERIKESYAVIVPSFSEDSPNVILEGLAFGKPFIMTKWNGLSERIGDLGIEVDPKNKTEITQAILRMADNKVHNEFVEKIKRFTYVRSYNEIAREFVALLRTL